MVRIDAVYKRLLELYDGQGITTIEIANSLGLNRANVSNDLNKLCEEGKVVKQSGKPVLFIPKDIVETDIEDKVQQENLNTFDSFVLKNESLYSAIEQAKAAILYPPKGMNMLILGETGVGKSMFVSLVHKYGIEMKKFDNNAPFITFNCADYASNPQLLLGQLFGCKKGSYTGADNDRIGLIEKANNGILFLDEVHRLPAEGQEMLFTFMDKGVFRKLGETEIERKAQVLIVCATTEKPEQALLQTFTRRIPMTINIPSLAKRTIEERFELISTFMKDESARLEKEIKVSINSIKALLSYDCLSNVGQLKVDIQLICAKAYAECISKNKNGINIHSMDLPPHVRMGLYKEVEHRQLWNKLIDINKKYCIFDRTKNEVIFEEYRDEINIYEMVEVRYRELRSRGVDDDRLQETMNIDIDNYFKKYIYNVDKRFNNTFDITKLEGVIESEIISTISQILFYCQENLGRQLSQKVCYGMAVHINSSIERIRANKKITNPQLNKIRVEHNEEFNIALGSLEIIERSLEISMPIDEVGFLAMFLAYDNKSLENIKNDVKVIVIAHGDTTATSMADAANKLLDNDYVMGINAPIDEKPEAVLNKLRLIVKENNIKSDILILVDMGSLTTFGIELEREFKIKTRFIPLVSTLHVIEAARKAMMGYELEELFRETIKVNELFNLDGQGVSTTNKDSIIYNRKLAILTLCTTGEGGAKSIEGILEKNLAFDNELVEIIPINIIGEDNITNRIERIKNDYEVMAIVSTFDLDNDVFQLNLEDIFVGEGISLLQEVIDIEITYKKMAETLESQLDYIDVKNALQDIKTFNRNVQIRMDKKININTLIGITLHIACMLNRVSNGCKAEEFVGKENFIKDNDMLYNIVIDELDRFKSKYISNSNLELDEVCYIMKFFLGNRRTK